MEQETVKCPIRDEINLYCSCTKTDCPRHGICCKCIIAHKKRVDDPISKRFPHCLRELVKEAMEST